MPQAGDMTCRSIGTRQGIYRPQVGYYYYSEKYDGIFCEVFDLPIPAYRDRAKAVKAAREWMKRPGSQEAIIAAKQVRSGLDKKQTVRDILKRVE